MNFSAHKLTFDGVYADAYIVLFDRDSGDLVNASTGAAGAAVTWAEAKIQAAKHAQSDVWVVTIPALEYGKRYTLYLLDGFAAADKSDEPVESFYYDPKRMQAFDSSLELPRN